MEVDGGNGTQINLTGVLIYILHSYCFDHSHFVHDVISIFFESHTFDIQVSKVVLNAIIIKYGHQIPPTKA